MSKEVSIGPYTFPQSREFLKPRQRAVVRGRLLVHDKYTNVARVAASSAYVGLAAPGPPRSWQIENKGYQFWTQADSKGNFLIRDVLPGRYNLYAWVPGYIGDYKYPPIVTISPGASVNLTSLVYQPPRNGPTPWEIGILDRSAAEFHIPNPSPHFKVDPRPTIDRFKEYGLWSRYADSYPKGDLTFTIGLSNYKTDWFFAHVNRKVNNDYRGTKWKIFFDLENVNRGATYTFRMALASATMATLQVRFNSPNVVPPHLTIDDVGKDNAIARHGIHGLYWLYNLSVPGNILINQRNTIFLTQTRAHDEFAGVMYDYIRLEGPPM